MCQRESGNFRTILECIQNPPKRKVIRTLFLLRVSFFSRSHFVLFVIPLVKLGTRGRLESTKLPRSGLHLANESDLSHRWPTPTLNPSPKSHQQLAQQHFSLKKSSGFNKIQFPAFKVKSTNDFHEFAGSNSSTSPAFHRNWGIQSCESQCLPSAQRVSVVSALDGHTFHRV